MEILIKDQSYEEEEEGLEGVNSNNDSFLKAE